MTSGAKAPHRALKLPLNPRLIKFAISMSCMNLHNKKYFFHGTQHHACCLWFMHNLQCKKRIDTRNSGSAYFTVMLRNVSLSIIQIHKRFKSITNVGLWLQFPSLACRKLKILRNNKTSSSKRARRQWLNLNLFVLFFYSFVLS